MPSIESLGLPLVFRVAEEDDGAVERDDADAAYSNAVNILTEVRCLEGMQKEALVRVGSAGTWRMVSDEGPYLNGTDLAPFPLAFFAAGMQFSVLSELVRGARSAGMHAVAY